MRRSVRAGPDDQRSGARRSATRSDLDHRVGGGATVEHFSRAAGRCVGDLEALLVGCARADDSTQGAARRRLEALSRRARHA